MPTRPRVLVLRSAGTNCDLETAHAFELAGAIAERVHLNRLLESPALLGEFQILALAGGFSYGDDIAAGKILAQQIGSHLHEPLREFLSRAKPIIGICNGFQVLVKTDLLPGPLAGFTGQTCTLAHNDCGRFVDRWVHLSPLKSGCIWTRDLQPLDLPIAHGEGKFVPLNDAVRRALWDESRVALVYATPPDSLGDDGSPFNPNGSIDAIAGVCDSTGLVLGMMPHPERFVSALQHPAARSRDTNDPGAGLAVFRNAVAHAAQI